MGREYKVRKYYEGWGWTIPEYLSYDTMDDMKPVIMKEYEQYRNDASFTRVSIEALPLGEIDFELNDRMHAIRDMCELGHKVRANTKIRNRQPLQYAYVSFLDKDIQNYMLHEDRNKNFADILKDELNVLNVIFMDETAECAVFDFILKPNFRVLGPKGFGKQAQSLKSLIQSTDKDSLTTDEKNELYSRLKRGEVVRLLGVPLTYSDVEVEFAPKDGFMSASNKVGAIVLNTTLDEHLQQLGFVADFRSSVQNIRKIADLGITDKIFLEVFCEDHRAKTLDAFSYSLRRELLATDIKFFPVANFNRKVAHQFFFHGGALKSATQVQELDAAELDKEPFYVNLYKELSK